MRKVAETTDFIVGVLGGRPENGGPSPGFDGGQWSFARGERLEILEPDRSPGSFMRRFVEERGPGVHHVTFNVPDLAALCARAEAAGYDVLGCNEEFPGWKEAFLHPKQALGIVVQLAGTDPRYANEDSWSRDWPFPQGPADPPAPEGPSAVEVRCARGLALPAGPVAALGARFSWVA